RLVRTGRPAPLSSGAQLTVYRVVQEALTNALKHARSPSLAEVRLDWAEGALTVEVVNDGARVDPASMNDGAASGRGLTGMRERAAAHGAAVEAGPRSPGGWGVRARLRLDEAADR
ncbi:MAG: ATP-binding protein, partial [Solirubrobacterales bacterium]